jgi:hypothetical protein
MNECLEKYTNFRNDVKEEKFHRIEVVTDPDYVKHNCDLCSNPINGEFFSDNDPITSFDICLNCSNMAIKDLSDKIRDKILGRAYHDQRTYEDSTTISEKMSDCHFQRLVIHEITEDSIMINRTECRFGYLTLPKEMKCTRFTPTTKCIEVYLSCIESLVNYTKCYIENDRSEYQKLFSQTTTVVAEATASSTSATAVVHPVENTESLLNWVIMEDVDNDSDWGCWESTGFMMNINDDQQVASFVADNHGRVSIDVLFKTYDDYALARKIWEENYTPKIVSDNESFDEDEINCSMARTFSEYCRFLCKLGVYYG